MKTPIANLGPIASVVKRRDEIVTYPKDKIWTGVISTTDHHEKNFSRNLRDSLKPEKLNAYFVPATVEARTRCIDGREIEGYETNSDLQSRPLGPQVPGGTAVAALAHRIVNVTELDKKLSFEQDIDDVIKLFAAKGKGIGFGGHIDSDHTEGNTGCGAIDNIPETLRRTADPKTHRQLRGLAAVLLGDAYDDATVDIIIGRIVNLQSLAGNYFEVDEATGIYRYKQKIINELRRNSKQDDPVSRLVGKHNEVALVVNDAPGTTFDRDRFSVDHGHLLQLFNYDVWYTRRGAELLYPVNNVMSYKEAKRNLRLQHDYITCRVLLAIAAVMVLTDGSIPLIIRG